MRQRVMRIGWLGSEHDLALALSQCHPHFVCRYDPSRRMALLVEDWVSRASAKQRRGRAGRVRPGKCFSLFTRRRMEEDLRPFQVWKGH